MPELVASEAITVRHSAKAVLQISLDPTEHQRRQAEGLGGITNWRVLDLLMELPIGEPVPIGMLGFGKRPLLRKLGGAALIASDTVTRQAVRPCRVIRAVVTGSATRESLDRAGRFAPFCARTLVIAQPPRRKTFLVEADFYGIGVILDRAGARETLVRERPWVPQRHTVAGWRFVEQQYARAIAQGHAD